MPTRQADLERKLAVLAIKLAQLNRPSYTPSVHDVIAVSIDVPFQNVCPPVATITVKLGDIANAKGGTL